MRRTLTCFVSEVKITAGGLGRMKRALTCFVPEPPVVKDTAGGLGGGETGTNMLCPTIPSLYTTKIVQIMTLG